MKDSEKASVSQGRKIIIFENSHALSEHLLKIWMTDARQAVTQRGRFTAALSGGRSPLEFYCKLSALSEFDLWKGTHLFMGDERFVPLDDDRSNFKMIKKNLVDYINIPTENIHPITTDSGNVAASADSYKNELIRYFDLSENKLPCFDFVLLGIGTDGHTASLFADEGRLYDATRVVLPVSLPHLKEERVSLTLPVINNARHVVMLVLGEKKADVIRQVLDGAGHLPAGHVKPTHGRMTFLLDREAAHRLPYLDAYTHQGDSITLKEV